MNGKLPISLLCVAALAFACGPRSRGETATGVRSTEISQVKKSVRSDDEPLSPNLEVSVDEGVRFSFDVVNEGDKKLEVRFASGRTHELVVIDSTGREVWRWSEGRLFTQALQNRVLRVSDALRFEDTWRDATPGTYVAVATLASENFPVEERIEFVVR